MLTSEKGRLIETPVCCITQHTGMLAIVDITKPGDAPQGTRK